MSLRGRADSWRRPLILAAAVWTAWGLAALWLVPRVIAAAYHERAWPIVNRLIAGRAEHPLGRYLDAWQGLAGWGTLALAFGTAGGFLTWRFRARVGRGLRQAAAAVTVPWPVGPGAVLALAVWIGLAVGLLEALQLVGVQLVRQWPTGEFYWALVWMAPLAGVLTMIAFGLPLVLVAWPWRGGVGLRAVPPILAALGVYGFVRSLGGVHPLAAAILAGGTAIALLRWLARHPDAGPRRLRRSGYIMALTVGVAGLLVHGMERAREWATVQQLPAAPSGVPSVLLIILDTVRAQSLSVMGYDRPTTPTLERVGADGVVFENAWATAPWTLPSHASIFTGRPATDLSTDYLAKLDDRYPTLAEVLTRAGYVTGGFVSNFFYAGRPSGLARGFTHYADHPMSLELLTTSTWLARRVRTRASVFGRQGRLVYKTAEDVNREFLGWLDDAGDRPFFAFLNYLDAHDPYDPPEPWKTRFAEPGARFWLAHHRRYSPDELRQLQDRYDGAIAYIDHQVGVLLEELRRRGRLDNTLVIVSADHGEQFGEHAPDLVKHGWSLYAPVLRVPLLMRLPGRVPDGLRIAAPVSIASIAPTVLDLVLDGRPRPLPGASLRRIWDAAAPAGDTGTGDTIVSIARQNPRERVPLPIPIAHGPMSSIVLHDLHYIVRGDGAEALYHRWEDPWEETDLSDSTAYRDRLVQLRRLLDRLAAPVAADR